MEQLAGGAFITCLVFIIPVALAYFVVRADWRIILKTCLIWYGFLLLTFGALNNSDGAGWALIAAMFYSTFAIPIISAMLKGWGWLGRSTVGVATTGPIRPWLQQFPISFLSPAQWGMLAVVVTGYFLGTYWYEQRDLNQRATLAGRFLGLPTKTTFASFQSTNSAELAPKIAAIVRFKDSDFTSFIAQLDNGPVWPQGIPHYDGAPVEVLSIENIKWRDHPLPKQVGDEFVSWNNLSAQDITKMQSGRVLCIALQRKPRERRGKGSDGLPRFTAKDCSEIAKAEHVSAIVLSAIDLNTKVLHLIIK